MKTTNKPITEKQISSYLKYFGIQEEWLFDPKNTTLKKEKWLKSTFTKFTDFGYKKESGLLLKQEVPEGIIAYQAFANVVSISKITDLETLTKEINRVRELQKMNQKARAEKVSEVLNTYTPEKRTKVLDAMKEGATELAKMQYIAQGKVDLHIADFSKETLEKLTHYQRVRDEINQKIKSRNREQELEQTNADNTQEIER